MPDPLRTAGKQRGTTTMAQNDTKKRERAAQLIAEDWLSDEKIAGDVGIGRRTLARWKASPRFIARVKEISAAFADRALKHALARKERRITVLNDLHEKLLQVIAERAVGGGGGKTLSMAAIQQAAKDHGVSVEEAKRQAQAAGYAIQ